MGEIKHLLLAKFKEDAKVDEIVKGLETLVLEIDLVKSYEWGIDIENNEMLRQGFTHAFMMTFNSKDDLNAYNSHPKHVEFSVVFSTTFEKILLFDFPSVSIKAPNVA